MTKTIQDIRTQIDSIDRQIHDLLMERAGFAHDIAQVKRQSGVPIIQPEREAVKMRDIMDRHQGDFSQTAMVNIWREIIAAIAALQTDISVAVAPTQDDGCAYREMARDYFGSVIPLHESPNIVSAINAVREGEAQFAVLPWPDDEFEDPWWAVLSENFSGQPLRIVVRLPYANIKGARGQPEHRALVIARQEFQPSGDDHTFLILNIDQSVSRARVLDKFKALKLNVVSIFSRRPQAMSGKSLHMVEVDNYVSKDDARLVEVLEKLESPDGTIVVAGGYPVIKVAR